MALSVHVARPRFSRTLAEFRSSVRYHNPVLLIDGLTLLDSTGCTPQEGLVASPMNELTPIEALELLFQYEGSMDTQFQLWLSITFGATAASFLARKSLTKHFSHFITAVYVLATTAIATRWITEVFRINILVEKHEIVVETFPPWGPFLVMSTLLMFAIGTIGCVFCVYYFREK